MATHVGRQAARLVRRFVITKLSTGNKAMSATEIIKANSKMECPSCHNVNKFAFSCYSDRAPLMISCPHCMYDKIVEPSDTRYMLLPKVDPTITCDNYWGIRLDQKVVEDKSATAEQIAKELDTSSPDIKQASFSERLNEAAESFLTGLAIIDVLKKDLSKVSHDFKEEIERVYQHSECFKHGWNMEMVQHFLMHPFSAFNADAIDARLQYAKFMISPKFYTGIHGVPIGTHGGMYVQLITPYSELYFPVESWLREELEVPAHHALTVKGGKVWGPTSDDWIDHHYKEIDGTTTDDDHSLYNTSILVEDKRLLRAWMVHHGNFGFHKTPVPSSDVMEGNLSLIKNYEENELEEVTKKFLTCGRIAMSWWPVGRARAAAMFLGTVLKGSKVIVTGGKELASEEDSWSRIISLRFTGCHYFYKHKWSDFTTLFHFQQMAAVIVDVASGVPLEFLEMLQDYTGKLILILPDPVMDTLEENELATACYSLCNAAHCNPGKDRLQAWLPLQEELTGKLALSLRSIGVQ